MRIRTAHTVSREQVEKHPDTPIALSTFVRRQVFSEMAEVISKKIPVKVITTTEGFKVEGDMHVYSEDDMQKLLNIMKDIVRECDYDNLAVLDGIQAIVGNIPDDIEDNLFE